jgi:hypothetical protein
MPRIMTPASAMAWATVRVKAARVRKIPDIIMVAKKLKRKNMEN